MIKSINKTDYILRNPTGILRCINRPNFIDYEKSKFNERKNDVAVLLIGCNSYENLKKCITYLEGESNQNFDIIIVDNSTNNEEIKQIHDLGLSEKISIIKPIDNIGGSGGYCIGMEYIISKGYESLICFEDDVMPIDKDMISETIKLLKNHDIVGNIVNGEDVFGMFHLRGYSVKLLSEKLGVVDPRLFLGWDDADLQDRCIKLGIRDGRVNTGKKCFHPSIKKNKPWTMCIYVRNHIFYEQKCPKGIIRLMRDLCVYILFGFSYYFITNQSEYLYSVFYGIYSFLSQKVGINSNNKILQKFKTKTSMQPKNVVQFVGNIEETNELLKDKYNLYKKITGNTKSFSELTTSDNPMDGITNGVVIARYLSWRFAMRYKTIICIDEYSYEEKKYYISIINNKIKNRYLKMLLSIILVGIIIIPISIVIMFKIFIEHICRTNDYKSIDK